MNKKGFTLVEILAVIFVLSIIMAISARSIFAIRESAMKDLKDEKLNQLVNSAILYGQDHKEMLTSCSITVIEKDKEGNESTYNPTFCFIVDAKTLIESNYFEDKYFKDGKKELINDVTTISMLCDEVVVYKKNNRVYATLYNVISDTENGICNKTIDN